MRITTPQPQPLKKSPSGQMIALALVIVFAAATNVYLFSRVKSLEVEAHTLRTNLETEIAKFNESSAYRNVQTRREFEDLRKEVKKARSRISKETEANTRRAPGALPTTLPGNSASNRKCCWAKSGWSPVRQGRPKVVLTKCAPTSRRCVPMQKKHARNSTRQEPCSALRTIMLWISMDR